MTPFSPAAPNATAVSTVPEATVQNFMQEVIQASLQLPVLVYFTAAWCGPCKQFGPLLEKVVAGSKGKVKLVRVDIDKSPQLAQQFRIQSVPMVYVFAQGQPLDAFSGALSESQLKQMITQLSGAMPSPEDDMVVATMESGLALLGEGNFAEAENAFKAILSEDTDNVEAVAGLARALIGSDQLEQAEQLLGGVAEDKRSAESVLAARAALQLAKSAPKAANLEALQKAASAEPVDHQAKLDYAIAAFASMRQAEAVEALLESIAKDKAWNDGAARTQLLTFFEALGFTHPLAQQGRRRLSSILFA